jgi:hypothetical protein
MASIAMRIARFASKKLTNGPKADMEKHTISPAAAMRFSYLNNHNVPPWRTISWSFLQVQGSNRD